MDLRCSSCQATVSSPRAPRFCPHCGSALAGSASPSPAPASVRPTSPTARTMPPVPGRSPAASPAGPARKPREVEETEVDLLPLGEQVYMERLANDLFTGELPSVGEAPVRIDVGEEPLE